MFGVVFANALPQLRGDPGVADPLAGQAGELDEGDGPRLGRVVRELDLLLGDLDELLPGLALLVQVLERADRFDVPGLELDDRLVVLDGLRRVGKPLQHERRDFAVQAQLLVGIGRRLDARLKDPDQIRPALHAGVDGLQRVQRLRVVRLEFEHRLPGPDDLGVGLDVLLVDVDGAQENFDLAVDVTRGFGGLLLLLQQIDEAVPLADLGVQPFEFGEDLVVGRILVVDALPEGQRLVVPSLALGDLGELALDDDRLVAHRGVELLQTAPVVAARVKLGVELADQATLARGCLQPAEIDLGAIGVVELLPEQQSELSVQPLLDALVLHGSGPLVDDA